MKISENHKWFFLWRLRIFFRVLSVGVLFFCLSTINNFAVAQTNWPNIKLPKDVVMFDVAEQITANGLPMRLQGFVSKTPSSKLITWFRDNLDKPFVEDTLNKKHVLGRLQGQYYLTVQIEATAQGSKGVIAVTDLKAFHQNQQSTQANKQRWRNRLPAGSNVINQASSADGNSTNFQLIATNHHSESLNRDALLRMMQDDGFELKRESDQNDRSRNKLPSNLQNSHIMIFAGQGKEAIVTIQRNESGETSLVLNTVTQMEKYK